MSVIRPARRRPAVRAALRQALIAVGCVTSLAAFAAPAQADQVVAGNSWTGNQGGYCVMAGQWIASTFVPSASGNVTTVSAWLHRDGTARSLTADIRPVGPTGTPTPAILGSAQISTPAGSGVHEAVATFANGPLINAGTSYALVLRASTNSSCYPAWSQGGDAFNVRSWYSVNQGASWNSLGSTDQAFKVSVAGLPDADGDLVADASDNCPSVPNANQANADGDAQGDACDADDDNDGVGDGSDNCAGTVAGTTVASDGCPDPDSDGKSTQAGDNCPSVSNADQANNDGDGQGDVCDDNDDSDTVLDVDDNCDFAANQDQADNDTDGQGDVCDADDDNDTVADAGDNCAMTANTDQANNDGDAQGDVCDDNDDSDTVLDADDNCDFAANEDQANNDGDAQGDACDADDDNDTVNDTTDNCAMTANTDQANNDADGQGDACDADDDNDGDLDGADNCQMVANADQRDSDGDGAGDLCDSVFDSTDGKTSGGGFLTQDGRKVNFSVSGKSEAGKLTGTCVVTVGTTKIKCTDVDGLYKSSTNDRIVMVGRATQNNVATRYRIELTDNGEPGTSDRIEIQTDSGFAAAGTIDGGNLQVHK